MTDIKTDNTLKAKEFRDIFQNSLKVNARSMSVKTLLSERNLKRINYSPYYQRNYVWDNTKQTFFIESVILGTEIPPLILFKTGAIIEVIDGRQRFETLLRFKENRFNLNLAGLKELQILNKKSFNTLSSTNQDIFLNSNIRVYEFEVINHPNLDENIIDRTKKEIFRRYNTGITPLTREELDNAKYDEDDFSEFFKEKFKKNDIFLKEFNKCFFPKETIQEVSDDGQLTSNDGLITKNVDFIRKFRILYLFPISTYAGSDRTEIKDLLYEFIKDNSENVEEEFENFQKVLDVILAMYKTLSKEGIVNKLIYECLLWAIIILKRENIPLDFDKDSFVNHYLNNPNYSEDNTHYYRSIIDRFTDTANFLKSLTNFDFAIYLKNDEFRKKVIDPLKQTDIDAAKSMEELSNLRVNKPNPIAIPIDEIRKDLQTNRYLVRPSYQRQEKINEIKASAIIESILLGIILPPIFIFKRKDNIKEVVDGQQRLLAIIGFLGDQFYNEDGNLTYSKNNNFKLKGLKILTDFEGASYSSLPPTMQDRILDFVIDLIVIEQSVNNDFDQVDLFIRLNYKPYPIKSNSFEMWNSIVNHEVIKKIKEVVISEHKSWFFLREKIEGKPDRMENEELITTLSYICFKNLISPDEELIGFFLRQDRITCRLNNKKGLGDFLLNLDTLATEKIKFLQSIERTLNLIKCFGSLFPDNPLSKEVLNEYLNVKKSKTFRRSLQDFYVIWLVIDEIPENKFETEKSKILTDIGELLSLMKNSSDITVDAIYFKNFNDKLKQVVSYYKM